MNLHWSTIILTPDKWGEWYWLSRYNGTCQKVDYIEQQVSILSSKFKCLKQEQLPDVNKWAAMSWRIIMNQAPGDGLVCLHHFPWGKHELWKEAGRWRQVEAVVPRPAFCLGPLGPAVHFDVTSTCTKYFKLLQNLPVNRIPLSAGWCNLPLPNGSVMVGGTYWRHFVGLPQL